MRAKSGGLAAPVVVLATGRRCNKPPGRPVKVGERFMVRVFHGDRADADRGAVVGTGETGARGCVWL